MTSGEFRRIRWLSRETGPGAPRGAAGTLHLGIGDDAALWSPPPGHAAAVTVDAQVEGVHFLPGWLSPREIGARAVSASASDLAAMGARPGGVLLAFTLPRGYPEPSFRALYRGALREARRLGLAVLGGNLSAGPLQVSVTALGAVRPGSARTRGGARPGDGIYVTGRPGSARIGRGLLEAGGAGRSAAAEACRTAFRAPRARIAEGLFIARRIRPRSLVDVSDGVALDLAHVLERSGPPRPGASLDGRLEALLEEAGAAELARGLGIDPLEAALTGGEDYELLFTAPPVAAERAAAEFRRIFRLPLTRIGTVERRPGLRWAGEGRRAGGPVPPEGFDHFR